MKLLTKALLALLILAAVLTVMSGQATASGPCQVNCPSYSAACWTWYLMNCTGGSYDGSVVWVWQPPPQDDEPIRTVTTAPLPEDYFQVYGGPPKDDHPWGTGGESKKAITTGGLD